MPQTSKLKTEPLVTFIIVCWNNRKLLEECFATIEKQTYRNYHVVVVDNASSDDSVAFIKQRLPSATLIESETNTGFAIGNNVGIKRAFENADCKYVALLNTDATLDPDWLEVLIKFAEEHPKGASYQTTTVDYYNHAILDSRGIMLDQQARAIQLGHRSPVTPLKTRRVFGVNAAAALFSRAFLETQPFGDDYFDSDMWMYLEDVDLATRAIVMGWENWFVGQSKAYHMGSASSSSNPAFSIFMPYRNDAYLLVKNIPASLIIRILPGLIATDLQSIYRHLRGKNYIAIKAMVRGRAHSLLHLGVYRPKRKLLAKYRTISNKELWALMGDKS